MKQTLLEKAKALVPKKLSAKNLVESATEEQIELALGWAKDEISLFQFTTIMWGEKTTAGNIGGKALYAIASFLKAGIKRGIIK